MSRLQESYQGIREQLVSLSVELDDRTKFIDILEHKIEEERENFSLVEKNLSEEYSDKMEAEVLVHKEKLSELLTTANEGMASKKRLLEQCKSVVEQLKEKDSKLTAQLRKITSAVNHDIEIERKSFRAGQEERQRKFLSAQLQEEVESTERALEPEFGRLRVAHEQEVADVELQLAAEERRARADLQRLFDEKLATEERLHKEGLRAGARSRMDNALRETESMEQEHRVRVERMTEELTGELEKHKAHLATKLRIDLEECEGGLAEGERRYHEKLQAIRGRHEQEVRALEKEHSLKMKELRNEFRRRKEEFEQSLRQGAGGEGGPGDRVFVEQVRRELTEARDRHLKAEIRRLQTEEVSLERELKKRVAEETQRVQETAHVEEEQLRAKEAQQTNEIADLTAEKTDLSRLLREAMDEVGDLQERVSEARGKAREAAEVQDKVLERHKELTRRFNDRMAHLEAAYSSKLQTLRDKASESRVAVERENKQFRVNAHALEKAHEDRLNAINAEVKHDLARKDEELDTLRDAVQTEKVKLAKLKKLLSRYS